MRCRTNPEYCEPETRRRPRAFLWKAPYWLFSLEEGLEKGHGGAGTSRARGDVLPFTWVAVI